MAFTRVNPRTWLAGVAFIIAAFGCGVVRAQSGQFSADAVKATFLHRFASYVEWPLDAPAAPFVIAVSGADEVARQLEALLPRVTVRGRVPQLRRVTKPSELPGVHILYVGPRAMSRTRTLRAAAAKLPILLVTDTPDGLASGAVINFVEAGRNVRFEISLLAADRFRLRIDSALLAVAARVERRSAAALPRIQPGPHLAHLQGRSLP